MAAVNFLQKFLKNNYFVLPGEYVSMTKESKI
jgi:hypothetical protein